MARLEELESSAAAKLDFGEMARKAESIFPTLTGCCCGVIADESGEYIILAAGMTRNLTPSERAVLENWLKTESGLEQAKLFLSTK